MELNSKHHLQRNLPRRELIPSHCESKGKRFCHSLHRNGEASNDGDGNEWNYVVSITFCCHSDCHFQGHQVSGIHRKICQRTQGHCVEVDELDESAHVESVRVSAFSFPCQFRGHKAEQNAMSCDGSSQQPMKTSPSLVASVRSRSGSLYERQGDVWKQRTSRSTLNPTAWSVDIPERILMQLYDVHDVHAAPGWNVMARRPQARRNWNASNSRWLWVQFFHFNISKFASAICWIEKINFRISSSNNFWFENFPTLISRDFSPTQNLSWKIQRQSNVWKCEWSFPSCSQKLINVFFYIYSNR